MKKINIAYWIITSLFSAFMILSSIGGLLLTQEAVDYLHVKMGYPTYFIQMISVAKILGAVAIMLPMLPARVKEWAYFGLFIDLVAAGPGAQREHRRRQEEGPGEQREARGGPEPRRGRSGRGHAAGPEGRDPRIPPELGCDERAAPKTSRWRGDRGAHAPWPP